MEILAKGENITLKTAQGAALERVRVGLGWDMKDGHDAVDVDLSILCLKGGRYDDQGAKTLGENALCYYGKLDIPGVHHTGDNRTGAGDGDDETAFVTLNALPAECMSVLAIANIYDGAANFGSIKNVTMNVYDNEEATPSTPKIDLTEDYSGKNAVIVAELSIYCLTLRQRGFTSPFVHLF
jgi:tellurium resistance protein TerD